MLFGELAAGDLSVRVINNHGGIFLYVLSYVAKNDLLAEYRLGAKMEKDVPNTTSEWRKGALLTCIGAAQRLFKVPVMEGVRVGKLAVHLEKELAEESDLDSESGEQAAQLSKLEQFFCRPQELESVRPIEYFSKCTLLRKDPGYSVASEGDMKLLGPGRHSSSGRCVFRDQSVAGRYVVEAKKARPFRFQVPSIFAGERFWLYVLLRSGPAVKLPCVSERRLSEAWQQLKAVAPDGQETHRAKCVENMDVLDIQGLPLDYLMLRHLAGSEKPSGFRFSAALLCMYNYLDPGHVADEFFEPLTRDLKRISLQCFLAAKGRPCHNLGAPSGAIARWGEAGWVFRFA